MSEGGLAAVNQGGSDLIFYVLIVNG
jgi:hypothetical protein